MFVSDLSGFWRERYSLHSGLIRQTFLDHQSELQSGDRTAFETTLATVAKSYGIQTLEIADHDSRKFLHTAPVSSPEALCHPPGLATLLRFPHVACFATQFRNPPLTVRWWVSPEGLERQIRGALLLFSAALLCGLALCGLHWWLIKRVIVAPVLDAVSAFDRWVRAEGACCAPTSRFKFHTGEIADLVKHFKELLLVAQDYRQMRDVAIQLEAIDLIAKQVSHDLRSPLSAMRVAVEKLSRTPSPEARALALGSFQRVNEILATLGQSGRPLSGFGPTVTSPGGATAEITPHAEDILSLVESIVAEHMLLLDPRLAQLKLHFEENAELFAVVEGAGLRRALSNLINNALEALPQGQGVVQVSVTGGANAGMVTGADLQITIEDNGIGIPAQVLERLGQRGVTLGKEHLTGSGSGLGVYQAKKAIEAAGGVILYTSELGRGTRVTIRLPSAPAPPYWARTIPSARWVVVVDDDVQMHRVWREKFAGLACELLCFLSAMEFEDWAAVMKTDPENTVYLLDFSLGSHQPTGFELVERNRLPTSRVTIVTAIAGNPDLQAQAVRMGISLMSKQSVALKTVMPLIAVAAAPAGVWDVPPISS